MEKLAAFTTDDFTAAAEREGAIIKVSLKGNADFAAIDAIAELFERVQSAARNAELTGAVIDVRHLEFMNSSCFREVIAWIAEIQEMTDGDRYSVTFLSNPSLHWQKRSLQSLQRFATDLISIVE
jgi:hypothetical protein